MLEKREAEAYVEMNPDDASGLDLADGDNVLVKSSHGEMKARLKLN